MAMRTPRIAFALVLLAGVASAQQPGSTSYTPERRADAPTFMNAEVVRVDRANNTVTFRSESRETRLTVEGEALAMIGSLHTGDKVVVGYRIATDASGRETRYVTSVRTASPTSGEPGGRRVAASLSAGSTVRARVLSYDRGRRRVTVIDETGGLRAIPIGRGVNTGLDALVPGANVAFNLGGTGTGVNVSGITSLGNTAIFDGGVAFPPVNGRFVSFNQRTGAVTLDTTTAGRVTFPAGSNVVSGFGGLRPGDNLSLNFDVTSGARQAQAGLPAGTPGAATRVTGTGTATGTTTPLAQITGVQQLVAGAPGVQAAGVPGAVSPVSPNTASINAPGLAGTPGATTGVGQQGAGQQGAAAGQQGVGTGQTGTGAGGAAQAGGNGAGTGGAQGGGQSVVGGSNVAVGGLAPGSIGGPVGGVTSPQNRPIPNVPGGSAILPAVLPPAVAKQPLSAEEVGAMRAQGEADLDNAAVALAAAAAPMDAAWSGFKAQCLRGFTPETAAGGREWYLLASGRILTPSDDGCRAIFSDLTARANGFMQQLETVEDAARKADVLPVRVREVFERHRLR
jgi:hypothetical protein